MTEVFKFGWYTTDTITSAMHCFRLTTPTDTARYSGFLADGSTSGYVVPGATTLIVTGFLPGGNTVDTTTQFDIGYADAFHSNTSAATNFVPLLSRISIRVGTSPTDPFGNGVFLKIPTGKYPTALVGGNSGQYCHLFGIER